MTVHAGADRGDALLVRTANDVVDLTLLLGGLAHADRTGHVRLVIAVPRAVVHKDEVTLLHHAVTGDGVRVGGIGAARDDGAKGQAIGTVVEHEGFKLGAVLLFRVAGTDELAHMDEGGVGDGLRMAHELDLLGVLDGAHELEISVHERQARADGAIL